MPMDFNRVGLAIFVIALVAGFGTSALVEKPWPLTIFIPVGLYFLFAIKVADQWERAIVLRMGKYAGLRGPGLFHIIPVVDTVSGFVDQRMRVTSVSAESP